MNREAQFVAAKSNAEIAPCLSVVMPVYNEEATVATVLRNVLAQRPVQELIVVDDCSRDKTWETLRGLERTDPRLKLLHHERNQGKGAALRTGVKRRGGGRCPCRRASGGSCFR